MSKNTPFRYDYVGSFLRPETLKRARRDLEEGKISKEEQPGILISCGDLTG